MCFCELASSLVDKTIPYVSAPLWSVPLPFPSANKNQSWLPMISINNYTGEIACVSEEKNSYCKATTNNRNKGVKAKLGKQTIGNKSQQKKHSVVPSRVIKHLIQIKPFKQRCNTVLLP